MAWRNRRDIAEPSGFNMGHSTTGTSSVRNQEPPASVASCDSAPSLDSEVYGTPDLSDDMHDILSPSFDSVHDGTSNIPNVGNNGTCDVYTVGSSFSADSIIRRVEEEIAAARKAASNAKSRIADTSLGNPSSFSLNNSPYDGKSVSVPSNVDMSPTQQLNVRASRNPSPANIRTPMYPSPKEMSRDTIGGSREHKIQQNFSPRRSHIVDDDSTDSNELKMQSRNNNPAFATIEPKSPLSGSSRMQSSYRSDRTGESVTSTDSIYFTDEEWQINADESKEGSVSQGLHHSSHVKSARQKFQRYGDIETHSSRKSRHGAADRTVYLEEKKTASESIEDLPEQKISSSPTAVTFSKIPSGTDDSRPNIIDAQDYPIIEKSSTEDATVNVQHHPVFKKRVSSADPSVVERSSQSMAQSSSPRETSERVRIDAEPKLVDQSRFDQTSNTVSTSPLMSKTNHEIYNPDHIQNTRILRSEIKQSNSPEGDPSKTKNAEQFGVLDSSSKIISNDANKSTDNGSEKALVVGKLTPSSTDPGPKNEETNTSSRVGGSYVMNISSSDGAVDSAAKPLKFATRVSCGTRTDKIANENSVDEQLASNSTAKEITSNAENVASNKNKIETQNVGKTSSISLLRNVETDKSEAASNDTNSEWDKASELLVKLKEQRASFSANFSTNHPRSDHSVKSITPSGTPTYRTIHSENGRIEEKHINDKEGLNSHEAPNENYDGSGDFDGNNDEQSSFSISSPSVRSPRYFNFMRVKRAKQRARKMSSSTNTSMASNGHDSDPSNAYDDSGSNLTSTRQAGNGASSLNDTRTDDDANTSVIQGTNMTQVGNNRTEGEQQEDLTEPLCSTEVCEAQIMQTRERDPFITTDSLDKIRCTDVKQVDPPAGGHPSASDNAAQRFVASVAEAANRNRRNVSSSSLTHHAKFVQPTPPLSNSLHPSGVEEGVGDGRADSKTNDNDDDESSRNSRRIRFRNPFPIVKPPIPRRDASDIINEHALAVPDIPIRWVKPKKELKQLIVAAMGTSLARRSNACGALKILTRHKKNQMTLVRTDGFLSAVTFAVTQTISIEERDLAVDARTRAVAALRNVCIPKDNRILILKHPGVVESLVHVVEMDAGEGRALAAGALALLAKTPCCREALAQVEGLVDILARVMSAGMVDYAFETAPGNKRENQEAIPSFDKNLESQTDEPDTSSDADVADRVTNTSRSDISIKMVDSIRNQAEEKRSEFSTEARSSACAALLHLSKQCSISHRLCTNVVLLDSLVHVANEIESPLHSKCLEIISNLTRFPANNGLLSRYEGVIEILVAASNSIHQENRLASLRSLQNMSSDPGSKSLLATGQVLTRMISCAMRKDAVEKEIAVATIYNISTEPSAVASITNTKNVVATLVHLAHSPDSSSEVRLLACEALSTISLWLQTLAGTGKVPQGVSNVLLPSQKTSGWQRWE